MIIGTFTQDAAGFAGTLVTLTKRQPLTFVPASRGADYQVTIDGIEVGAAWKKTSREGNPYLSVKLDSPFLSAPVHCALIGQGDGTHALIWSRDERKAD